MSLWKIPRRRKRCLSPHKIPFPARDTIPQKSRPACSYSTRKTLNPNAKNSFHSPPWENHPVKRDIGIWKSWPLSISQAKNSLKMAAMLEFWVILACYSPRHSCRNPPKEHTNQASGPLPGQPFQESSKLGTDMLSTFPLISTYFIQIHNICLFVWKTLTGHH